MEGEPRCPGRGKADRRLKRARILVWEGVIEHHHRK